MDTKKEKKDTILGSGTVSPEVLTIVENIKIYPYLWDVSFKRMEREEPIPISVRCRKYCATEYPASINGLALNSAENALIWKTKKWLIKVKNANEMADAKTALTKAVEVLKKENDI